MPAVTHLGVTKIAETGAVYAQGVRGGPWLFLTGHLATDFETGIDASVRGEPGLPLHGLHPYRREGDFILKRIQSLLESAGSGLAYAVRLDQYYSTAKAVDPYHHARKAAFPKMIPPSTSVVMRELLVGGAHIDASLVAVMPGEGLDPRQAQAGDVPVPPGSGFVPSLVAGDYVFVAGQMANDEAMTGLAEGAARPPTSVWGGTDIRLQTEFLIKSRLTPALTAADSSLKNAIKAQVYLTDINDLPDFLDVWNRYFADNPCALTILPTSGLGSTKTIIEINILAVRDKGAVRKEIIRHDASTPMRFGPAAVRAGDLLCLSGLFAADAKGAIPSVAAATPMKYLGVGTSRQMGAILEAADAICNAADTSLDNTLRAHHFFEDLNGVGAAQRAWQQRLPDLPVPFGAVGVEAPLPVPGCDVTVDLWAYCPAS